MKRVEERSAAIMEETAAEWDLPLEQAKRDTLIVRHTQRRSIVLYCIVFAARTEP